MALDDAQQDLIASTAAVNIVAGLKIGLDSYLSAFDTAVADKEAVQVPSNVFQGALAQYELDQGAPVSSWQFGLVSAQDIVDTIGLGTPIKEGDLQITAGGDPIIYYNGSTWEVLKESAGTLTPALKAAGEAYYDVATTAADSLGAVKLAIRRLVELEDEFGEWGEYIDASFEGWDDLFADGAVSEPFTADSNAFDYVTDTATLAKAQETLAVFNEAAATYNTAVANAAELDSLNKAVDDAIKNVQGAGFEPGLIGADKATSFTSTDGNDVFVLTQAIAQGADFTIADFGALGNDYLDVSGFTRGADLEAGKDAVLEYFIAADGDNAVITFEMSEPGSNAATPEVFTITLVGVNADDLVQAGDFLTV